MSIPFDHIPVGKQQFGMDDTETLHRRARLRELVDGAFDGTLARLVDHIHAKTGKLPNQAELSTLRRDNGPRSFGDKKAKTLTEQIGLHRRWFDFPIGTNIERTDWLRDFYGDDATASEADRLRGHDVSEKSTLILEHSSSNTFKRAPVVAWACLGDDLRKPNENWPAEAMRVIYSTKPMSGLVKWIEVVDDLLAPRVVRGDIVVVDPDGKPMVDSPVLVRLSDGTHVLRFYRPLAGDAFEVFDGAGRTMDSVRHGIVVAATFVTLSRDSV